MARVLINFAHPSYETSRGNRALIERVKTLSGITVNDLYEAYPDAVIDVDREQRLMTEHDVIIFQHPFFWYSSPALLKEWLDLVLTHGWAYGSEGKALSGKRWMQAITTGGGKTSYGDGSLNRYSIDEFLRPFEATAHLCSMDWLPPRVFYGALTMSDEELDAAADDYADALQNWAR